MQPLGTRVSFKYEESIYLMAETIYSELSV
jgi:hypothetical protein